MLGCAVSPVPRLGTRWTSTRSLARRREAVDPSFAVPVGEQNYQGGVLSRFFQDYGVNPGDLFDVLFGP